MNKMTQSIFAAVSLLILAGILIWMNRDAALTEEVVVPKDNSAPDASQVTGSNSLPAAQTSPPQINTNPSPTVSSTSTPKTMTAREFRERLENDEEFALAVIKAQVESNPDAKRYMQGFATAMFPIEFHGIVVGKDNAGLPDVTVVYKLGYPYGYGYTKEATVKTDAEGRFMIRDHANSLLIKQIQKDDFELLQREIEGKTFGLRASRGEKSWSDHPSESPYRIVMSKKD